jgi:hypothetical protein
MVQLGPPVWLLTTLFPTVAGLVRRLSELTFPDATGCCYLEIDATIGEPIIVDSGW